MPGTTNFAQKEKKKNMIKDLTGPKSEPTTAVLLNERNIKMPSKFVSLCT